MAWPWMKGNKKSGLVHRCWRWLSLSSTFATPPPLSSISWPTSRCRRRQTAAPRRRRVLPPLPLWCRAPRPTRPFLRAPPNKTMNFFYRPSRVSCWDIPPSASPLILIETTWMWWTRFDVEWIGILGWHNLLRSLQSRHRFIAIFAPGTESLPSSLTEIWPSCAHGCRGAMRPEAASRSIPYSAGRRSKSQHRAAWATASTKDSWRSRSSATTTSGENGRSRGLPARFSCQKWRTRKGRSHRRPWYLFHFYHVSYNACLLGELHELFVSAKIW